MSFNSVGQYSPNHKTWDHLGNIFPNVEHSEGTRPAGEFQPAAWLPVKFFDKYYEDWYVITPGKILAFDNNGDLVPAQYATGSVTITYTQDDVDQGTIDVRTGSAVSAAGSVAVSGVSAFMGASGVALAVSKPIGVAPYAMLQWCGGDGVNPTKLNKHNYNRQHAAAFLCDYVLSLPLVPAKVTSESLTFGAPVSSVTKATVTNKPVAKNTVRSPIVFSGGTLAALFVNEVDTAAKVKASGDWHIDLTTGVVSVFKGTAGGGTVNIQYFHYASAPSTLSVFASAVGNLVPGDFVVCDDNSNFKEAAGGDNFRDVIGQVIEVVDFPRSGMEYVRTAFSPALNTKATGALPGYAGQLDQLAGSATGGVPDTVHFAGAANKMVRINLISR